MKRKDFLYIGFVFLLLILPGADFMDAGFKTGQHAYSFDKKFIVEVSCDYLLHLPKEYSKVAKRWPLIMFLHGAGERGNNLELVKRHGLPKVIKDYEEFPFIVVSPQCPKGQWWDEQTLIGLLDELEAQYVVDTNRVYLTGLSMGGFGTWSLATKYPDRFAAIAPVCGGGYPYLAYRLAKVPIWAFHGAKDRRVPLYESKRMVEAVKHFGGQAKLTVYPRAGHDCWTETYDNPELYNWFLEHQRGGPTTQTNP